MLYAIYRTHYIECMVYKAYEEIPSTHTSYWYSASLIHHPNNTIY